MRLDSAVCAAADPTLQSTFTSKLLPVLMLAALLRYRLMSPSKSYSTMYAAVQARFDLAVRCRTALCQQPYSPAEAVQACVLTGQHMGGSSSKGYSMQQLQAEAPFLAGQMKSLQQVGCELSSCVANSVNTALNGPVSNVLLVSMHSDARLLQC